ncbi:DUF3857 domain-containing transglutaminase family protein [Pedobacter sp. Leaf194]|uniref:DUF3857 domain-containing protein n=1 Tax=Pedobacter sp. Leaf194 TaxID=1736297 RepID=UPI000703ACA6|nr:DUF3857 domain-containing transglutaminase family protein [Pedobacter sp. Leaf194]KQS28492.1 hypothetical protein ASG14_18710 [Pedobacter sp. Leaf194]
MKQTFLFFCFMCCATLVFSQDNYDSELIPSGLKSRANATIRTDETTIDMRAPDNVMLSVKKAITVLNKNGDDKARLVLFYDKNTAIKSIKGEVYNAAGILTKKFNQSNFNDESAADGFSLFVDSRLKHYLPSENIYPYTVVYNYEIRFKQNLIIPDWIPQDEDDISVEKSSYTFISKPADELRIKTQNYQGAPEETVNEKQKTLVWKASNITAVKPEPYSPSRDSYQTSVKIAAKNFTYYNYSGKYANWQELGKWNYDDLLKNRRILPQETVNFIKNLVSGLPDDKEKAKKIYEYMQKKTRYISVQIGIGGFQPVTAAEVDRLGYGDCKALVNYTQSLLDVAGIESYYCVVEAGDKKVSFDPDYASMVQGNHVILCMPLKGDTTWLECTSQKIPFGFLSTFTDDRLVLACTKDGGKLLRTPKLATAGNLQIRNADLNVMANGDIAGKMKTTFYGSQYENNEDVIDKAPSEQKKLLADIYDIDNINFKGVDYIQNKVTNPEVIENISLELPRYGTVNNNRLFLKVNAFNVHKTILEARSRIKSVYINRGFTDEDKIVYNLPDEVETNLLQQNDKNLKSIFGEYISKTVLEGKKLTYYRKLVINEGTFPAEKYAEFFNFTTEVNTADNLKLILNLKK